MRRAAWLVLTVACSSSTPPLVTSGTRLRAREQIAGDARRLVGWHDVQLDLDCGFEGYIASRAHRCVPANIGTLSPMFFTDATCATALVLGDAASPPAYAIAIPANSCTSAPTFFTVGAAFDPARAYSLESGTCAPAQYVPSGLYELGTAVPDTTFASATEQPGADDQLWLVSDDGARAPWGAWDGSRGILPAVADDGVARWAPWMVAYQINAYADAGCTMPAATKDASSARCPLDAVRTFVSPQSCNATASTFQELGSALATIYTMQNGTCTEQAVAPNLLAYTIGPAIATDSLPEASIVVEGSGAVGVRHARYAGHVILQAGTDVQFGDALPSPDGFVDSASGLACEPLAASDGMTRCLPRPTDTGDLYFSDSACRQPVLPLDTSSSCTPSPPSLVATDFGDGVVHAWPVLATTHAGALYYIDSSGHCAAYPGVPSFASLFDTGPELPAARFAEVREVVD